MENSDTLTKNSKTLTKQSKAQHVQTREVRMARQKGNVFPSPMTPLTQYS